METSSEACQGCTDFFSLQGKAPKEIHAIVTETLACFFPGWAEDLSAPLPHENIYLQSMSWNPLLFICSKCQILIFLVNLMMNINGKLTNNNNIIFRCYKL